MSSSLHICVFTCEHTNTQVYCTHMNTCIIRIKELYYYVIDNYQLSRQYWDYLANYNQQTDMTCNFIAYSINLDVVERQVCPSIPDRACSWNTDLNRGGQVCNRTVGHALEWVWLLKRGE